MATKYNDFQENLAYSLDTKNSKRLDKFYLSYFVGAEKIELIEDIKLQKKGIDKKITFRDGRVPFIEEKIRKTFYNDILLEIWSVEGKKKGWLFTSQSDYICYSFLADGIVYMLPTELLRIWAYKNRNYLKKQKTIVARNKTYNTISKVVPAPVLLDGLKSIMLKILQG